MNKMNTHELVSALADGQLADEELSGGIVALGQDLAAREAWQAYHLIGDVLRSPELAGGSPTPAFMRRLSERLAAESPHGLPAAPVAEPQAPPRVLTVRPANDPVFRWKLVAGLASMTAAAAVGWSLLSSGPAATPMGSQLAGTEAGGGAVMIRDAQLDELLAAHQRLGGPGVLQTPAPFVRQANFEGAGR